MGWTDRDFNQSQFNGRGGRFLDVLSNGAIPLGTYFRIRVRMHVWMAIYIALTILTCNLKDGIGLRSAVTSMAILFFSVLLHEFGHCFGARWMGGEATDILMWPLGGLASTDPPHRWRAALFTTIMGPAVNFAICIVSAASILILNHLHQRSAAIPWFPLQRGGIVDLLKTQDQTTFYLFWIFLVNYGLLTFNLLLVFYPFDGGRIVQELLWWKLGYNRSMRIATKVGMVGAVGVVVFGIATGQVMLMLIGVFGFITCYYQRQHLRETGAEDDWHDSMDFSQSLRPDSPRKRLSPRAIRRAQKAIAAEHAEHDRIDAILAKVSARGMGSLTWYERHVLHQATARRRKQEAEYGVENSPSLKRQ